MKGKVESVRFGGSEEGEEERGFLSSFFLLYSWKCIVHEERNGGEGI